MKTSPVLYPKSYPATDEYANNTHVLFGNANKGAYINPYADMVRGYKESNNLLVAAQAELKQKLDFITQGLDARVLVSTTVLLIPTSPVPLILITIRPTMIKRTIVIR